MNLAEILRGRIKLDVPATNWEDAVRRAGAVLEASGDVLPSYTEAMVRVVRELGPYAVVAPGVALPHARPEDGVVRTCLGLVRLSRPVEFGNRANDPVYLVFPFGATGGSMHVELLAALARFLATPRSVDELRQAGSEEEVLSLFGRQEWREGS